MERPMGYLQQTLLSTQGPIHRQQGNTFGPGELQTEVCTLPGLRKAFFTMALRWLKLIEAIDTAYSFITFAISDLDGAITSTLMMGRAALFSKDVTIKKWIDKPPLVQCLRCHALRHTRSSKACPLSKDSIKCFICASGNSIVS